MTRPRSEIRSYYERRPEETRLERGLCRIEALRTRMLIERLAPAAPGVVIDVGGAAGAYAFWLASRGYTVHLVDPIRRLLEQALLRNASASPSLASCLAGEARSLPFALHTADAVLLLGPLYHLTERADRIAALREARRVLRPGGVLFAAGITRWAAALDQAIRLGRSAFTRRADCCPRCVPYRRSSHRHPSAPEQLLAGVSQR